MAHREASARGPVLEFSLRWGDHLLRSDPLRRLDSQRTSLVVAALCEMSRSLRGMVESRGQTRDVAFRWIDHRSRRVLSGRRHSVLAATLTGLLGCSPVEGARISDAPINVCGDGQISCDRYAVEGISANPQCEKVERKSRCQFGRPDYPFFVVVNVPDSSVYAAGRTFVLTNEDLTLQRGELVTGTCQLPGCVRLPDLRLVNGRYRVTHAASLAVGMPLPEDTSIPVRVAFVPLTPDSNEESSLQSLPLDDVRTSSSFIRDQISFSDALSIGRYRRILLPQAPFDAFFPPISQALTVERTARPEILLDDFKLGETEVLDDDTGLTRTTTIRRREGLDGFRVWLADEPALGGRRISSIKTLTGVEATVVLHTAGARQPTSQALRENVDVIIAPPEGWIGVPRLESLIVNGGPFGFRFLEVPELKPPVTISGVIAQANDDALTGIAGRLLFTSNGLLSSEGRSDRTLKYETAVSTDDAGRFVTVLPQGFYDVTVEPAEGTGFAKVKEMLETVSSSVKTFRPPRRTIVVGRAVLADGRPLSEASVMAIPADAVLVGREVKPRPARARTDRDGQFRFEVDQGQFNLVVVPQPGTDFPRVVTPRRFAGAMADVGEIRVAPPSLLAFQLREPSQVGTPIARALVRVFAELPGRGPPAVEIGQAMTDSDGRVEVLLAPRAR